MLLTKKLWVALIFVGCYSFTFAQELSYFDLSEANYAFESWEADSEPGTYPTNALFHVYSNEPELADEPSEAWLCRYDLTTRARINGLGNDGVSFFNTGSTLTAAQCQGENGTEGGGFVGDFTVGLNTIGRENIRVNFTAELLNQSSGNPLPREYELRLQYRVGTEGAWSNLSSNVAFNTLNRVNGEEENYTNVQLPSSCNNQATIAVRWKLFAGATNDGGTRPRVRLDDILIQSEELDPEDPVLILTESIQDFEHFVGTPSDAQSFIISGENLTSSIIIAANPPFEISFNALSDFDTELTLSPTNEIIDETTVFVRMNANQAGFYSNLLTISGGGITTNITRTLEGTASVYVPPYDLSFPTPYSLKENGNYLLSEWSASNNAGTYPENTIFHVYENEPTENDEPVTDWLCTYDLSARSRINGLGTDGFSFFNTASSQNDVQCNSTDGTGVGGFVGDFVLALNTEDMENLRVSFVVELLGQSSGSPLPRNYGLELMYRTDEMSPWLNLPNKINYKTATKAVNEVSHFTEIELPADLSNQPLVQLRWHYFSIAANDGGSRPRFRMDDFLVEGDEIRVLNPTVTVTEVLNTFHQVIGTSSVPQLFLVQGEELLHSLEIEVPYPYLLSLNETSNYSNTITLEPEEESIPLTPIFVKLNAVETGVFERELIISSNSLLEDKTISLIGETHLATEEPQVQLNTDSLIGFSQLIGEPSPAQFFILNGVHLAEDLLVSVNPPYELSLTENGSYSSSLLLTETDGTVALRPLFVRLNATEQGSFQQAVYITGGGLSVAKEIHLSGSATTPPAPQLSFSLDSITEFIQEIGTPSSVMSLTLTANNLVEDIHLGIAEPFEISTSSSGAFSQTLTLSSTATASSTTLFVRLNATVADTFSTYLTATTGQVVDSVYISGISIAPTETELLHYWHFNHLIHQLVETNERLELNAAINADYSAPAQNAHIALNGFMDSRNNLLAFPVSNKNLHLGTPPNEGGWLRINNPSHAAEITVSFSTKDYSAIEFDYVTARAINGAQFQTIHYSLDDGITWNLVAEQLSVPVLNHQENWLIHTIDLSNFPEIEDQHKVTLRLTFEGTNSTGNQGFNLIDNLTIKGKPLHTQDTPKLLAQPISIQPFYQELGQPSPHQTLLVAATQVTGAVSISAPSGYEIKTAQETTYGNTINLLSSNGTLNPNSIHLRLNASTIGMIEDTLRIIAGNTQLAIPLFGFCAANHAPHEAGLIYYWHFNQLNTVLTDVKQIPADYSITDSVIALLTYEGAGIRDFSATNEGSAKNLQLNATAGQGLHIHNPALTRSLRFDLPTEGLSDLVFEYVTKRSFEGMKNHAFSYSLDGETFTDENLIAISQPISETEQLFQFDFSTIPEAANNPDFKIRIHFDGNTTLKTGYNFIDNVTLKGNTAHLATNKQNVLSANVFPNPCDDHVTLHASTPIQSVSIYSSTGQHISTTVLDETTQELTLTTQQLNSGIYFIKLTVVSGEIVFKRLMKQ